jgi:DNA-binding FrmR family transcriptional regulator
MDALLLYRASPSVSTPNARLRAYFTPRNTIPPTGILLLMAHTIRQRKKLVNRVRRIRGQVEAIERALVDQVECGNVLQRIAACRGAIDSLLAEVLEDHIRFHVVERHRHRGADPVEVGEELIELVRSYLR